MDGKSVDLQTDNSNELDFDQYIKNRDKNPEGNKAKF